jgi:hypothetical protein
VSHTDNAPETALPVQNLEFLHRNTEAKFEAQLTMLRREIRHVRDALNALEPELDAMGSGKLFAEADRLLALHSLARHVARVRATSARIVVLRTLVNAQSETGE